MRHPFHSDAVAERFQAFPDDKRERMLALRALIFDTAQSTPGVGPLQETLKWNQPAYLTKDSGSGTTLRLDVSKQGSPALYVHCQTSLIQDFRAHHPDSFDYEGNRAARLRAEDPIPDEATEQFIRAALTYHLAKR